MNILNELTIAFTLGFITALLFGFLLGRAIEKNKKKKAGLKPANINCSRKLYQIKGGRSMVTVGEIVHASDAFYGSYVGKVIEIRESPAKVAQIQILACLSYPKQYAELYRDKPVERKPYLYLSIQAFPYSNVGKYVGDIPNYSRSVKNSLNNALKKCRPVELPILLKHCDMKAGEHICVG